MSRRKNRIGLSLLLALGPVIVFAGDLQPFTTDGCSSFPDGTSEHHLLWSSCCVYHDVAYWKGGTREQRSVADEALAKCVESVGQPKTAKLMLAGVRLGGTPYLPTSYRWGYGWPFPRGYKALTEEEESEVEDNLDAQRETLAAILNRIKTENN